MFGFGEKPKALSAEGGGQGEERSNEKEWAEMVAGQKSAKPIISAEGLIEPEGISEESLKRGYEGGSQYKSIPAELVSSEGPDKIEMLASMRASIEGFLGKNKNKGRVPHADGGDDERKAA